MSAKSAGKKPRVNEHDIARARAAICPALPVLSSSGPASSSASGYARADSPNTSPIRHRSALGLRPSGDTGVAQSRADEEEPTTLW